MVSLSISKQPLSLIYPVESISFYNLFNPAPVEINLIILITLYIISIFVSLNVV